MKWLWVLLLLFPNVATAYEASPLAANPQAEARLKALAVELRCLVCQIRRWPIRTRRWRKTCAEKCGK